METKAHHALVGFFVVFLAAAAALFTLWISQIQFDREFEEYDVVFDGPVRGLRESSEVRFNGIQVGEVIDLGLNPDNPNEVIARIRVDAATPVKVDSFAQLEPQGLTGLSYIQLSGGSPGAEALQSRSGDRPARIFARQAQLEGLVEGGETVIENAQITLTRFNRLLSDENIENFTLTLDHVEDVSRAWAENDAMIERLSLAIDNFNQAAMDISSAAEALQQFGTTADSFVVEQLGPMVEETTAASIAVNQASVETFEMLEDIRPGLESFADEGLESLTTAARDLRVLISALERIAVQLEEDPAGFLSEPRGREIEVPQ
ncbi:MlaD family protein [Marinicauda sp. Alg238-R41]|uniref:MlaD family protein n=1 Tax=Marinicauda sp. Alg238-R41 TaxID=2993447 RepID=UPI0022E41D8F|nr:MlaD family protein [Marinicauda sp. Alg238-R41]